MVHPVMASALEPVCLHGEAALLKGASKLEVHIRLGFLAPPSC